MYVVDLAGGVAVNADTLKTLVVDEVDAHQGELVELSHRIHDNPEVSMEETKAAAWLTDYLERYGFAVQREVCELPTACKCTYGDDRPRVAFLAEYDALPELGHACGHNIIGAAAVGAAVAARAAVDAEAGSVAVVCTPAEETVGGKILMTERGAFDDIDAAMLIHPSHFNTASVPALACVSLDVDFLGRAAHASAFPEEGINALGAMIQAFVGIDQLRQHFRETARIHGVITHGGDSPTVVPDHTSASFLVRAEDESYLEEVKERVLNCFKAASLASGAQLEYSWGKTYDRLRTNRTVARAFAKNMEALGRAMSPVAERGYGSSDMGNVCSIIPCIHAMIAIAPPEVTAHSLEFAEAAGSETGDHGLLDGAKAMAMTLVDLVSEPETMARVRAEFLSGK